MIKKIYDYKKLNIKSKKGLTTADITVSIIAIALFTGVIANLMYSSFKLSHDIQMAATADAYATAILEKVDEKSFTDASSTDFVTNLKTNNEIQINDAYTINYAVADYGNYRNSSDESMFKKITLTISYTSSGNPQTIIINKLKVNEKTGE